MTADLELDFAADGQAVTLAVGQGLRLQLEESPTTGYQWSVLNSGALTLESNVFMPAGAAIGGGGTRVLRWRACVAGSNEVMLVNRRAWEPIDKAIGRFAMTVVVAGP
jgi:predicted secreted protein